MMATPSYDDVIASAFARINDAPPTSPFEAGALDLAHCVVAMHGRLEAIVADLEALKKSADMFPRYEQAVARATAAEAERLAWQQDARQLAASLDTATALIESLDVTVEANAKIVNGWREHIRSLISASPVE